MAQKLIDGSQLTNVPNQSAVILGSINDTILHTTVVYAWPSSDQVNATRTLVEGVIPIAGTVKNFYVDVGGNTIDDVVNITIWKGAAVQPVTVQFAASTAGSQSDLVNSFPILAGDKLSIEIDPTTGAPTGGNMTLVRFSFELEP